MTPARLILALAALAFLGFGATFLVSPVQMAALLDLALETPTARTEVRAMYGGLELGFGVFLLTRLGRRDQVLTGLSASLCVFAGLAAARAYGLVVDGMWQPTMWLLGSVEAVAAALCWWAIRRVRTLEP